MNKNKQKKWIKIVSLFFLFIILYSSFIAVSIADYSKRDETVQADCAIILGAGVSEEAPSPVFASRIDHGIWLYKNGYVKKLIMTGGVGKGGSISDAEIGRKYAVSKGVPEEDILFETKSVVTQENIKYAAQIMEEEGMKKALIVSDPLHMKRAMRMAKDFGLNAYSSPTKTSRYQTLKTQAPFLAREVFFYIGYPVVDFIYLKIN